MFQNTFPDKETMAELTAKMLLEINAVHFRADQPYKLTSGLASPVYIDCRKLISYPRIRAALMDFAVSTLLRDAGFEAFDAIAGGETAGIPFAAWIAERMGLPMQYVRKKPKGFGRDAFADALREAGAITDHTLVIFYYDVFPDTQSKLAARGLKLHHLATWWDVLAHCRAEGHFDTATLDEVEKFLHQPLQWSQDHGGSYQPKV